MSLDMCNTRCQGYKYSSIQAGTHCFCGDSYGRYGKVDRCSNNCPVVKDGAQAIEGNKCGGWWANSVYEVQSRRRGR